MKRLVISLFFLAILGLACDRSTRLTTTPKAAYFPSAVHATTNLPRLGEVSHWLYLLDIDLDSDVFDRIQASSYDMVVIDFFTSEAGNEGYPLAEWIDRLHAAPHPKFVSAYIDVGEAEAYRSYWKPNWRVGNPEWIISTDPDGWEENYPVAYWYDEYQQIWLGEGGYLQAILDAGFDGVYLDWIEAYSDEAVADFAEREGVDPVRKMIGWVGEIAAFARVQKPGFIVIAQNAAELIEYDEYVETIDAIAQEQIWFDGGADNDPPGDCSLPRTQEEVDAQAYRQSLSPACRRQFDAYPDGTLHASSEEYLYYLALAQSKGLIIFTVDYALDPVNIALVYATSRGLGFIPFVTNRQLDRYLEPFP